MAEYRVIPYTREQLPQIVSLWEESGQEDVPRRRELFEWFTGGNPHLRGRPPYWCLHDGERVVGMHGHMPLVFDCEGREVLGHLAQDDLLSPACRGKGLGRVLLNGVLEQASDLTGAMWFNEPNHRSYLKAGWTDVPGFHRWVFFLSAGRLAAEAPHGWQAAGIRVAAPFVLPILRRRALGMARPELAVESVDRFGAEHEALYRALAPQLGIIVRRSAEYLNWRFVDKPEGGYERRQVRTEAGALAGWAVRRLDDSEETPAVRVVELLVNPSVPGALETLLAEAIAAAVSQRATHVVLAASSGLTVPRIRRMGFLRNPREDYHMVTQFEGRIPKEKITDISSWTLNLADADGDVWA